MTFFFEEYDAYLVGYLDQHYGGILLTTMTREPTHPVKVFYEDVMKPLNLSVTKTAVLLGDSRKAMSGFINEKTSLSPDMALRICIATKTTAESWMNMQKKLSLWNAA